jgi:hypothetical protein
VSIFIQLKVFPLKEPMISQLHEMTSEHRMPNRVAALEQAEDATTNHQRVRQRGLKSGRGVLLE